MVKREREEGDSDLEDMRMRIELQERQVAIQERQMELLERRAALHERQERTKVVQLQNINATMEILKKVAIDPANPLDDDFKARMEIMARNIINPEHVVPDQVFVSTPDGIQVILRGS